ncbi:LPS export ABC transporter periplasmic protein LptC [Tianweitania sp. BSSL-BM11]|uniref:LPS export ABC transporter periplasmic protein LptC n=1 Tax=Tianweitania aestuarii TaxID=2814886 RepID=A0ABS5RQC8_9HYPH|nr:LPS export ABC transporter periplasmic protein LptC [Tianweitania aestuarii]MBS9719167.1 LPS export ABC transporter periplasmic protein LptC [Tianweitania aestuarii]
MSNTAMVDQTQAPQNRAASGLHSSAGAQPTERVDAQFASAARHSGRVRLLKIALPLAALAMAGAFAAYSFLSSPVAIGFDLSSTAIRDGKLVMAAPKLEGYTTDNLPYAMTAARAVQDASNTNVIELEDIDATVPMTDGTVAKIDARKAIYDRLSNTIMLNDPMTLSTDDGKSATFQSANIDMGKGTLVTEQPVVLRIKGASIDAGKMSIAENGKVIVFDNRVQMNLDPGQLNAGRAGNAGSQSPGGQSNE